MAELETRSELIETLQASLMDAGKVFNEHIEDANTPNPYERHVSAALSAMNHARPRVELDRLEIIGNEFLYPAPPDAIGFVASEWTKAARDLDPVHCGVVRQVPRPRLVRLGGEKCWRFCPVPTYTIVEALGCDYCYEYHAAHVLTDEENTLCPSDRELLLLRAQAEALKDISLRNSAKPVEIRASGSAVSRNGSAAALYDQLMAEWRTQVEEQQ